MILSRNLILHGKIYTKKFVKGAVDPLTISAKLRDDSLRQSKSRDDGLDEL